MILDEMAEKYIEQLAINVKTNGRGYYHRIFGGEIAGALWEMKDTDCEALLVYIIFNHGNPEFVGKIIKALESEMDECASAVNVSEIGAYLRKTLNKQDRILLRELI